MSELINEIYPGKRWSDLSDKEKFLLKPIAWARYQAEADPERKDMLHGLWTMIVARERTVARALAAAALNQ